MTKNVLISRCKSRSLAVGNMNVIIAWIAKIRLAYALRSPNISL